MDSHEEEANDGLVKPMSAYHQYLRLNSGIIKEELIKEGG